MWMAELRQAVTYQAACPCGCGQTVPWRSECWFSGGRWWDRTVVDPCAA